LSRAAGNTGADGLLVDFTIAVIVDAVADFWRWSYKTGTLSAGLVTTLALTLWKSVVVDKRSDGAAGDTSNGCDVVYLSVAIIIYAIAYFVAGSRRRHTSPRSGVALKFAGTARVLQRPVIKATGPGWGAPSQ
jgi:hypothetical protein